MLHKERERINCGFGAIYFADGTAWRRGSPIPAFYSLSQNRDGSDHLFFADIRPRPLMKESPKQKQSSKPGV
jgi:hypothetical protein